MEVLSIKAVFPNGLNESIKTAFPDVTPIIKPEFISNTENLNGHWIAGFTQADGSFGLNLYKSSGMKLGYSVAPTLRITQHERDYLVLEKIIEFWGCGNLYNLSEARKEWTIKVSNTSDLVDIIIPFYQKYNLYGAKYEDFLDFSTGVSIFKAKGHLTSEGLSKLKELSSGMNSLRKF